MNLKRLYKRQAKLFKVLDNKPIEQVDQSTLDKLQRVTDEIDTYLGIAPEPQEEVVEPANKFLKLRETSFDEYIGQERHVERLKYAIHTARKRDKPLPHMAFTSQAGSGKTTLAACIANEMSGEAWATTGSALRSLDDIADLVQVVGRHGIAFIDEAHDLAKSDIPIISGLLPLLEDWKMHISTEKYRVSFSVEPFTCILATTNYGMLDQALISRMGIPYRFDEYTEEDLAQIALVHADKRRVALKEDAALEIGKRARGNPRKCLNLMMECNNIAIANGGGIITPEVCTRAFDILQIDPHGFTLQDKDLLLLLSNGSASAARCANAMRLDKVTYEKTVEPYLLDRGLIAVDSRGRKLTDKGETLIKEIL